jgi:integrase
MTQLSQASARAIRPGEELRCHVVKGLSLRGKPSGARWFLEYRSPADGTRRRPKLGDFPALSVEAARSAARTILQRVAAGDDPSGEKQAARSAPTVADLHAWYMENHSKPRKSSHSQYYDNWYFKRFFADSFGKLRVADVTSADVNSALDKIAAETSDVTANRCRSLLAIMFAYAEADALKWRPQNSNPITKRNVPKRAEFARRRYLSAEEIARIAPAMVEIGKTYPRHVAAISCILYAGSRVTELVTAKHEHVEGAAIVRRDHKSARTGKYRTIRLPEQAWRLIRTLPHHPGGWIFGPDVTVDSCQTVWAKVRALAGIPDVQVRDLRRTFASRVLSSGHDLSMVSSLLDHSNPAVTRRHYAFLEDDAGRRVVQSAADGAQGLLPAQSEAPESAEGSGR